MADKTPSERNRQSGSKEAPELEDRDLDETQGGGRAKVIWTKLQLSRQSQEA